VHQDWMPLPAKHLCTQDFEMLDVHPGLLLHLLGETR
jgi:hypothetical protein